MPEITTADVAILMPPFQNGYERFAIRYGGLAEALAALSIVHFFAEGHDSYSAGQNSFTSPFTVGHEIITDQASAPLVRDLTMALDDKPLYTSVHPITLVHHPDTNRFIANKANLVHEAPGIHPETRIVTAATIVDGLDELPGERVVVKPVTGHLSRGVQVISKEAAARTSYAAGDYLLQEFIDTSAGIPALGIEGVHNLRVISIGSLPVGAIARIGGDHPDMLHDDIYGHFIDIDNLPDSMHAIINTIHAILRRQPGDGENVVAIDLMRGRNAQGEEVDVLCEVNRRPMRIGRYDTLSGDNLDNEALLRLGGLWDRAEAQLLSRQLV